MADWFEFHWWYIPFGLVLLYVVFGKNRGGFVVRGYTADLEILDDRFRDCRTEADYNIFKQGSPDHIEIEIDDVPLPHGEELVFVLNGDELAKVPVKRNREAEFDVWGDEGVSFPQVNAGDELVILYKDQAIMKGSFKQTT